MRGLGMPMIGAKGGKHLLLALVVMLAGMPSVSPRTLQTSFAVTGNPPPASRAEQARLRVMPELSSALKKVGLELGDPVFMRIFKQEKTLELWLRHGQNRFNLFRSYPICTYSGELGPKTRQGDGQAPEGFYEVGLDQLNPASQFHLSFNLGYPNRYERAQGWTGDYLMVHGSCVSIGCYAMGDAGIDEIYTLVEAALRNGQKRVSVHAFPFRFEDRHAGLLANSKHRDFWLQLEAGYRIFEQTRWPPRIHVQNRRYAIAPEAMVP